MRERKRREGRGRDKREKRKKEGRGKERGERGKREREREKGKRERERERKERERKRESVRERGERETHSELIDALVDLGLQPVDVLDDCRNGEQAKSGDSDSARRRDAHEEVRRHSETV